MLALAATLLTRSAVVILRTGGLGALLRSAHDAHGGPYGPGHAHGAYGGGHGKEQALR